MTTSDKDKLLNIKAKLEVALKSIDEILIDWDGDNKSLGGERAIAKICDYAGLTDMQLCEDTRKSSIVFYRRIACYILTDYFGWTQQRVADRLLLNNHASVLHHRNKLRAWMTQKKYAPYEVVIATNNIINNLGL